jgi:hypothetical protein
MQPLCNDTTLLAIKDWSANALILLIICLLVKACIHGWQETKKVDWWSYDD